MGIQLNGSSGADIISSSDGTLTIDGTSTVSTPIVTNTITISDKISHTGDSNTHIRFAGDDTVTVETAGSERLRINSSGKIGVGIDPTARLHVNGISTDGNIILARCADSNGLSSLNLLVEGTTGNSRILFSDTAAATGDAWISYGHSDRAFTFTTAGTANERLRIDSNGDLRVAASTDLSSPNTGYKRIIIGNNLIFNAGSSAGGYTGFQNNAYVNSGGNWVRVNNDHASSIGMDDGNIYFRNIGAGTGNISWNMPLQIAADGKITVGANSDIRFTNGTWTGEVAGKIQHNSNNLYIQGGTGGIRFRHASSGVNQFSMTNGGNFEITNGDLVVASGHGIDFSATSDGTTKDNELFDDYEEGYFTPTWYTESSLISVNYHTQKGFYIKIGKMVYFQVYIRINSRSGGSGNMAVYGLPFTSGNATASDNTAYGGLNVAYTNSWSGDKVDRGLVSSGSTKCYVYLGTSSGTNVNAGAGNLGNGTQFRAYGSYVAA